MIAFNEGYIEFELDNGLVVALQKTPTQTVAAKLRINFGPFHERKGEEGLSHYLEHCLVTGGSLRYDPTTADETRGMFGGFNAYTSLGRTYFTGQLLPEHLEIWLDYTSDHVLRPRLNQERIAGEQARVLREISDAKSDPSFLAGQELNDIFYREHPKGTFTLGRSEVVRPATQETMRDFHERGYHPNNMDLIIVGALPDNIEELISNYFGLAVRGEDTRVTFPEMTPLSEKTVLVRSAPERLNASNLKKVLPRYSFALLALT